MPTLPPHSVRLLRLDGHDPIVVLRMLMIVLGADMVSFGGGVAAQGAVLLVNLCRRATHLGIGAVTLEAAIGAAMRPPVAATGAATRTNAVYWSHIKFDFYLLRFRSAPAALPERPGGYIVPHRPD